MTNALKGHIALFAAQLIYALNYSIAKGLMPTYIGPLAIVFMRVIGACALFWLLSLFTKTEKVERADLKKIMLLAVFGVVVNQVFFIYGLSLSEPINSAIIMISNPIIVFVFTLIVLKERITFLKISGLSLAIAGALTLILFKGNFELGSKTIKGDLMTFVNAISWAIFVVMVKPLMMKYNTVTVMRWLFLFGTIYIIPIGVYDTMHTNWSAFNNHAIFALSFVVIATTFFAYFLNVYGLKSLSPNVVSMYIYMQPFLASIFAILMGKDTLTATKLFSGVLIICGLYLVNYKATSKKSITND